MKKLLVFGLLLSLFSCSDTYRDFQSVKDMKWYKSDSKIFEVDIKEKGYYDLFFAMRYSTGYPFKQIKINIAQKLPDGIELFKNAKIQIANEKNEYLGEVTGQLWDIEALVSEKTYLNKGKYTFKISHAMNNDPVVLVIDVGLIIKQSE